jgi:hypothetical protein
VCHIVNGTARLAERCRIGAARYFELSVNDWFRKDDWECRQTASGRERLMRRKKAVTVATVPGMTMRPALLHPQEPIVNNCFTALKSD